MKKIGITGSVASGKTTASKMLSLRKGPLFSADTAVKKLYSNRNFKKLISKKFNIKNNSSLKKELKRNILKKKKNFKKLERIVHPLVRREMRKFIKKNKNKKFIFFEIPLLVESNLMKNFDVIFFIKANKILRLKRFRFKGGSKDLFNLLDKKQLNEKRKANFCDHVVVNEKDFRILKKRLSAIFKQYE